MRLLVFILKLLLFAIFIDIFTHQIWKIFSTEQITWHGDPSWTIQDIAFSIGKSLAFLTVWCLVWLFSHYIFRLTKRFDFHKKEVIIIKSLDIISSGMIILALNDLYEESTGLNQHDTYVEWIGFGITVVLRTLTILKLHEKWWNLLSSLVRQSRLLSYFMTFVKRIKRNE